MDTVMYGTGEGESLNMTTDAIERGVKEAVGSLIVEFGSLGRMPLVEQVTLEDMILRYREGM
jgi:fructose-bisphosphate aldolase class II